MNTLTIPQIFSNIAFFQANYLNIIADHQQYFVPVEGSIIDVWPFKKQQLFLGDLLQLWFAEKWKHVDQSEFKFNLNQKLNAQSHDAYIYAIEGNLFTGSNSVNIFKVSDQCCYETETEQLRKFIFEFKALSRPKSKECHVNHEFHVI